MEQFEESIVEKENIFYGPQYAQSKGERGKNVNVKENRAKEQEQVQNNGILNKHNNKNKRGPGTPITPSLSQNVIRRKVEPPVRYLQFADDDIRRIEYENWLLTQRINYNNEVRKFYQLEQEYNS